MHVSIIITINIINLAIIKFTCEEINIIIYTYIHSIYAYA